VENYRQYDAGSDSYIYEEDVYVFEFNLRRVDMDGKLWYYMWYIMCICNIFLDGVLWVMILRWVC
jgi:hypothetical protein